MSDAKLLPCPFCGGEAVLYNGDYGWNVRCKDGKITVFTDCPAKKTGEIDYDTEEDAIVAWNTRAERMCHIVETPLGIHDDTTAEVCSECRVTIDRDCNYCPNCGCKVAGRTNWYADGSVWPDYLKAHGIEGEKEAAS